MITLLIFLIITLAAATAAAYVFYGVGFVSYYGLSLILPYTQEQMSVGSALIGIGLVFVIMVISAVLTHLDKERDNTHEIAVDMNDDNAEEVMRLIDKIERMTKK